jgi:hypothetical protein
LIRATLAAHLTIGEDQAGMVRDLCRGGDAGPVATVVGRLGAPGLGSCMPTGGQMATARRVRLLLKPRHEHQTRRALVETRTARPATDAGMAMFRHAGGRWMSDENADHSQFLADSAADLVAISP